MEDRLFFSVQSRGCYAFLQNDTVDDFVRNPDGSIRMDIAMQYEGDRYSRVGFDVRAPNTFSGFVACLEKRAQEAEELLKGSEVDLRVEDNNADGLMLIDTRTGKAMSCRALLKDYLSTFNFLYERTENLTIYLSLPPEYDDMQKSQFIKILKTVTTARIVYTNPFYGLFIEACNPQEEFTREALGDTSVVILSLGYYFSVISVVNYRDQLSVRNSIVSTTLSIKNLIHTVSESLVNEQLGDLARTWTEAEKAETILELMKLVLCSPTDIGQGDRVDIDFGNMPRGERRRLAITIEHFNQCAEFINELNTMIDAVLRNAGLNLNNILRFGVYSELNVHSMVSDTIARKVGQDKLSILANSGEDYLIVGLLWLQTLFEDSLVDGDSLIRNDIPPPRIDSPPARIEPSPPARIDSPPVRIDSPAPRVDSPPVRIDSPAPRVEPSPPARIEPSSPPRIDSPAPRVDSPPVRIDSPAPRIEPSPHPLPPTGTGSPSPLVVSFPAKPELSRSRELVGAAVSTFSGRVESPRQDGFKQSIAPDDNDSESDVNINIIVSDTDSDSADIVIEPDTDNDRFMNLTPSSVSNLITTSPLPPEGSVPTVNYPDNSVKDYPDPSPPLHPSTSVSESSMLTPPNINPTPIIKIPTPIGIGSVNPVPTTTVLEDTPDFSKIPSFQPASSSSAIPELPLPPDPYAAFLDS